MHEHNDLCYGLAPTEFVVRMPGAAGAHGMAEYRAKDVTGTSSTLQTTHGQTKHGQTAHGSSTIARHSRSMSHARHVLTAAQNSGPHGLPSQHCPTPLWTPGGACAQGYIQDPEDEFYVPQLARLSAPGAVFDPLRSAKPGLRNTIIPLVPILIHIGIIVTLNQVIYRRIAVALTRYENHRLAHQHRASLVIKRFLFEAFDCYIALFYLAFWHLDIMKVRMELQGMFTGDCARRLALEVLLPWLLQRVSAARRSGEVRTPPSHSRLLPTTQIP